MIALFEGLGYTEVARISLYFFEWIAGLSVCGIVGDRLAASDGGTSYFGSSATCKLLLWLSALATFALSTISMYQLTHYFKGSAEKECMPRKPEGFIFLAFFFTWAFISALMVIRTPWPKKTVWGMLVIVIAWTNVIASFWSACIPYYEQIQGKGVLDATMRNTTTGRIGLFAQPLQAV